VVPSLAFGPRAGALHPALDPEEAARKVAAEEAEKAILAKKAADEVLAQTRSPKK
jgi:hypothetical protein